MWKAIPFAMAIIIGAIKMILILNRGEWINVFIWCAFCAMWFWIFYAFWKDKDMPSYSGEFRFNDGKSDVKRLIYMISSSIVFLIGAFWG